MMACGKASSYSRGWRAGSKGSRPGHGWRRSPTRGADARGRTEGVFGIERLVEFIAYSAEIGFAKPDPRAYTFVTDRLGVRPEQTVFVDDSPTNTAAAAALGMACVRHIDPEQMIHEVESALVLVNDPGHGPAQP